MRKVKGGKGGEIHLLEKGETANPNGRPKGARNRATIVREWLETMESYVNPITKEKERLSQADIITLALINKARKGDVAAFKELMDSCFGKIADQLDMSIDDKKKTVNDFFPEELKKKYEQTNTD
jgi:hypothetical protein